VGVCHGINELSQHLATGPSNTVAATRPNKEHRDSFELPFLYLALAICDENSQQVDCDVLNGRERVPVPADREIRTEMEADDGDARKSSWQ
jgi:GAF domain-containing protein